MQYLLMCCIDEKRWMALPAEERDGVMRDYGAWVRETERASKHRATGKLMPSTAAKTIRMRDGKSVITDGPFAETKEQLGGYHLLECSDLDEAMALALLIPTLKVGGTIEVRALEPPI